MVVVVFVVFMGVGVWGVGCLGWGEFSGAAVDDEGGGLFRCVGWAAEFEIYPFSKLAFEGAVLIGA